MTTSQSTVQIISLAAIVESEHNARKTFNLGKLEELAASIKAQGLLQRILLRPLPGSRVGNTDRGVTHEIVYGHRRFRACKLAGLSKIEVDVKDLDDGAALEVALIENLQRDDLSELEEAEGYAALCSMSNITKDELASKVHRSTRYIFNRLKLLKLQPLALTALRTGQIDATTALQIATVHDGDLQAKTLDYVIKSKPSTRDLQSWMRYNVMLALNKASFDITDITLNKAAGSCGSCTKRTGADPDIFAETTGTDSCCDAPCYHAKAATSRAQAIEKYTKQGIKVIMADTDEHDDFDEYDYSLASQTREDTTSGKAATLLDLLGKKGQAEVGLVAVEDAYTKEIKVLVNDKKAEAWLLAQGLIKPADATASTSSAVSSLAYKLQTLKRDKDRVIERAGDNAVEQAIQQAVLAAPAKNIISVQLMRASLCASINHYHPGIHTVIFDCPKVEGQTSGDYETQLHDAINAASTDQLQRALALELLEQIDNQTHGDQKHLLTNAQLAVYNSTAQSSKFALSVIQGEAERAERENIDAQIAELEAKLKPPKPAAKTAPTQSPAGAAKSSAQKQGKPAPAKKSKLTAKEAQLGIADAMQTAEEMAANAAAAPPPATPGHTAGQRIKVLPADKLRPVVGRFADLLGTITSAADDECIVKLDKGGRGGGVRTFLAIELEAA